MSLKQDPVRTDPLPGAGRSPDKNHRTDSVSVGKNVKPWVKRGTLGDECEWELPPEPEGFLCWGSSRFMVTLKWDVGMCRCFFILIWLFLLRINSLAFQKLLLLWYWSYGGERLLPETSEWEVQLWDSCLREIRTAEWDQATVHPDQCPVSNALQQLPKRNRANR